MRRVIVPALLAVAMVAGTSANAHAFGLFDKFCKSGCDTGCAAEPACGCEVIEPACGCEVAAPVCGCEVAAPVCDTGCGHKGGLLAKLFGKHHGCDSCCDVVEPACGCEVVAPCAPCMPEPACGCEMPCEPTCDSHCGGKKPFGFLKKLFSCKDKGCDSCCEMPEPACGCEVIEPACGLEVAAPACGCH